MARETATWLGMPFDKEIFIQQWSTVPDPKMDALIGSGVVVASPMIAAQITHGNYFTIPYYNLPEGMPGNYDGKTDVPIYPLSGTSQSGVVTGRKISWEMPDFAGDLSGSDPIGMALNFTSTHWRRQRQTMLLGQVGALFQMTDAGANTQAFIAQHTLTTDAPIGITDVGILKQKALGDNAFRFKLAIMHSRIAMKLSHLNLLEFRRYTDSAGMERQSQIADMDGLTVVVDDDLIPSGNLYTTYLFGTGTFLIASGPMSVTAAVERDEIKNGGTERIITGQRITMHPNGFSFTIPSSGWTESPTDPQLFNGVNWKLIHDHKAVPIAKLVTDETII